MPSPLAGVARFPRARLGHAPTPIDAAPNLGAALGIDLCIKRDDCTGLAFGGNKVRQLEFHFGEARARGATRCWSPARCSRTWCASPPRRRAGSAWRSTSSSRTGSRAGRDLPRSGNLLLDRVLGATLHPFPEGEDEAAADAAMEVRAETLAAGGRKPYVIHSAPGHPPLGGLGYVARRRRGLRAGARAGYPLRRRGLRLGERAHPCRAAGWPAGAGRADGRCSASACAATPRARARGWCGWRQCWPR